MRQHVEVSGVHPTIPPEEAIVVLRELDKNVILDGTVRKLRVEPIVDERRVSHWEVKFRKGILRWSQEDEFDEAAGEMRFHVIEGDAETLEGSWGATPVGDGSRITFSCVFDLGIPTLSEFLDPLAKRILTETIVSQLGEIFGPELRIDRTGPEATNGEVAAAAPADAR